MITFTLNFEITLNFMIWLVLQLIGLLPIIKFKSQSSKFVVPHVFQEQCVAWHAFARITAASVVQDVEKLLHRDLAPAYIYEGAHYGTYHVSEETVGGNLKIPGGRGGLDPSGSRHVADGGLVVTACLAESRIVFVMQEILRRLAHLFEMQLIVAREGILARMDIIMIGTRGG